LIELKAENGRIVCERCLVAEAALTRMRGLLGRSGLEEGEGLLLRRASSIHTFFMRFPIDAVFLGRAGEVLKVAENLAPWRAARCSGARSVLELPAGESARRGLEPGIRLLTGLTG
jgi:uncharacterized protein